MARFAYRFVRAYGPSLAHRLAPRRRFVIVTSGRTGSELLVSLLNSHPAIICHSELLAAAPAFPDRYVASRAAVVGVRRAEAYGWKLLTTQFRYRGDLGDPLDYPRHLHDAGTRVIVLERRNLVQQALSWLRTGHGFDPARAEHHTTQGDSTRFEPQVFAPEEVLAGTYLVEVEARFLQDVATRTPNLRIVYEDDLLSPTSHQRTLDRICAWLGIPPAPVSSHLVRITPHDTRAMIANIDEVEALLSQTRYACYLERDRGLAGEPVQRALHARPTIG